MSNLAKILAAGALALSLAGTASAATLTINGGSAGTIPGGTTNGNNALVPLGLAGTAFGPYGGYYGSQIGLTTNTKAKIKFTLLGWEAAYLNTFTSGAGSFGSNGSGGKAGIWNAAGLASFMTTTLPGLLNFSFETDGGPAGPTLTVNNGTNTVPSKNKVNFFASVVGDPTATEGNSLFLFFDDDGNTQDDNHDDLVVRVDVAAVPVPAAGFMLFGALGGLAALRRRRKAA
jgi:hypothetical protein